MLRALLLALAAVLASCTEEVEETCPGEVVAAFAFTGLKKDAGALEAGLDPDPALTDCSPAMGFPDERRGLPLPAFRGTLAVDGGGPAGALCRSDGSILFGTRTGNDWVVESNSDGAVLGGCDPTCAARSRVVISGRVVGDPVTAFQGALVEQLTFDAGACGACVLPCAARYELVGATEAP